MASGQIENSVSIVVADSKKETEMIPLKSLIISQQIYRAVLKISPSFDFGEYVIEDDGTFPLSKMETMLNDKLYDTKERPPIDVSKGFRYYTVVNGRHRVARALALGLESIEAKIQ